MTSIEDWGKRWSQGRALGFVRVMTRFMNEKTNGLSGVGGLNMRRGER